MDSATSSVLARADARPALTARLALLLRAGLALAFLAAGALKLWRPEVFAVTIRAFGILPDALVTPVSIALPALEAAGALLLLFDRRWGLELVTGLLLIFVAILVYALRMGLDVDCGCYGPSDPEREAFGSIRDALWRDGAMLAGAAYLFWRRTTTGRTARAATGAGATAREQGDSR
uniref:Methylamine utilisation protein MauE domain-containing protein n=1 Tax=Fundidesulfovibrio putealis TaxID=270496 RepID=A0A7C3WJE0_9BACT